MIALTPGDRVTCADGRTGTVKRVDWGGVYVELDATDTQGRELRVDRESTLEEER